MFEVIMLDLLEVEALFCSLDIASARLSFKGASLRTSGSTLPVAYVTQCDVPIDGESWQAEAEQDSR